MGQETLQIGNQPTGRLIKINLKSNLISNTKNLVAFFLEILTD